MCFYVDSAQTAQAYRGKQALIRLYISSISAALLMASIEAQISAAFAADAPKTQFVRPTDADAWGGSTDKKTWTKPTDEKKPEGPQSLEDGRWGPSTDELTFYARKSWADRQAESVAHGELKERAKQGDRIAACDLGILHLLGERGARKSGKEALRYFTESAEAGDARAATNLAVLLSRGDGVAKDPAAAVRWYGVAAQSKTKSKLRDMHDLRSVPRPPPPTPPPPPPVRTFSEEASGRVYVHECLIRRRGGGAGRARISGRRSGRGGRRRGRRGGGHCAGRRSRSRCRRGARCALAA